MSDPFGLGGAEDDPFGAITPGPGQGMADFFAEHPPASLAGLQSGDTNPLDAPFQPQPQAQQSSLPTQDQHHGQHQQQLLQQQQYQPPQRQGGTAPAVSVPAASSSATSSFIPAATEVGTVVRPMGMSVTHHHATTAPSNHSHASSMHSSHLSPPSNVPQAPLSYSSAPAATTASSATAQAHAYARSFAPASIAGGPSSSSSSSHHARHLASTAATGATTNAGFDVSTWVHNAIGGSAGVGAVMAPHAVRRREDGSTDASGSAAQSNCDGDDPPSKRAATGARGANDADPEMREHVLRYLRDKAENGYRGPNQTITILHSRVVQKSYGSEKRFFCPPPAVQLDGERWQSSVHGVPHVFVSMGSIHTQGPHHAVELDPNMYGSAKTLFISDSDKRKSFCLHFKVFFSDNARQGRDVGTFTSRPIKVISKPPKKKQSTRTSGELCIEDGSDIALFNRVRSQTAKTRYLVSDSANGFRIDTSFWSTFRIALHQQQQSAPSHANEPRYISYGSTVVLTCSNSGERLGPFRVRRVEARNALAESEEEDDPVSQLQKVALQQIDGSKGFVTLANENSVKMMPAKPKAGKPSLTDASLWTVTSCDRVTYMFCEPRPPHLQTRPVNPVPTVSTVKAMQDMLELYGEGFTTHLRVWFGSVPAETFYRCEELLLCHRPPYSKICPSSRDGICREPKTVPLLLVRNDGVVYDTGKTYTYEVDHVTIIRALARYRSGKASSSPALSC